METSRYKNIWFWIGIGATILAAMGVAPEMFTSWGAVYDAFFALISNPYQLGCVILAIIGVFVNPTTKGLKDSVSSK